MEQTAGNVKVPFMFRPSERAHPRARAPAVMPLGRSSSPRHPGYGMLPPCLCGYLGVWALCAVLAWSPAQAQSTQDGRLIVTVVDTSGAVVPGATVTVSGARRWSQGGSVRAGDLVGQGDRDGRTAAARADIASRPSSPASRSACCRKCACAGATTSTWSCSH